MALNPQLSSYGVAGSSPFPTPYSGEYIACSRPDCNFRVEGLPNRPRLSFDGCVFVTNYRLVFVPNKPDAQVQAVELPLLFIEAENVVQPIFGSNALSGLCRPVDAPAHAAERIKWTLRFVNGGMGTLVPLFFAALQYVRVASRHSRPTMEISHSATMETPSFVQTALLDPNDPTKVYLTSILPDGHAGDAKFPTA